MRGVVVAGIDDTAGVSPISGGWVEEFSTRENFVASSRTTCDKDLVIGEQRRRMVISTNIDASGIVPLKRSGGTRLHQQ